MLAIENAALPAFQRFGGNTAYVEGWALYTESLGPTAGLFTDPYQLYGHYNDEMLRAMRLVVDTGIQALAYKIGQLTIRRLRTEAEQSLREDFDPREFHSQVLDSGALPLSVLERKIRDWIASRQPPRA